ncbi:MAG: glycoside hydrolase, partial [Actinomycetota bacterium]|nr:glycoside hydrolase [Actinomycetota bacterium]
MRRPSVPATAAATVAWLVVAGLGLAGASAARPAGRPAVRTEAPVTAVNLVDAQSNNTPAVAVDPTEPRFVVMANRIDLPAFSCALHVSGDGGRGWLPAQPVPRLPPGAERCYAPEVAFDADGVLYYLFVGLRGTANTPMGVYLTTSDDHGRSFSAPRRLLGKNNFAVRMAIDPTLGDKGRIHLAWLAAGAEPSLGGFPPVPNPIMAAHSDDGGKTFSTPVQVSDPDRARVVAPALAVGADHAVHVVYYDLGADAVDYQGLEGPTWEGNWSLVSSSSTDGGRRFSPGVVVDDAVVPPERVILIFTMPAPALAADGAGRVYVAWYDARNGDWDVFVRRSPDQGRTWEGPERLNDDAPGAPAGRHQYLPRLSVAPGGRVDAIFYDRRNDPENLRNDVYYAFAPPGGAFGPNLKVTTHPSSSGIGPRYPIPSAQGLIEFGSRLGLASTPERAYLAWTDTRNSLPGEQQDVFAAEVSFVPGGLAAPRGGDRRLAPGVLVAAAGALGAAVVVGLA